MMDTPTSKKRGLVPQQYPPDSLHNRHNNPSSITFITSQEGSPHANSSDMADNDLNDHMNDGESVRLRQRIAFTPTEQENRLVQIAPR